MSLTSSAAAIDDAASPSAAPSPAPEPPLLGIVDGDVAAQMLRISRRTFDRLVRSDPSFPRPFRIVDVQSLRKGINQHRHTQKRAGNL